MHFHATSQNGTTYKIYDITFNESQIVLPFQSKNTTTAIWFGIGTTPINSFRHTGHTSRNHKTETSRNHKTYITKTAYHAC